MNWNAHDAATCRQTIARHVAEGRLDLAAAELERLLAGVPGDVEAACNLGVMLTQLGRANDAVPWLERAARLAPREPVVHFNLGNARVAAGDTDAAANAYRAAIRCAPGFGPAHANLGDLLLADGAPEAAVAAYRRALAAEPGSPAVLAGLGRALLASGRDDEGMDRLQQACAIAPSRAEWRAALGRALLERGVRERAVVEFQVAQVADPASADRWADLGEAHASAQRHEQALACYELAVALDPAFAEADCNAALMMLRLQRSREALGRVERALRQRPDLAVAAAVQLEASLRTCEWADLDARIERVRTLAATGHTPLAPLTLLALTDDPAAHRDAAERWAARRGRVRARDRVPVPPADRPLTIAYVGPDFGDHPVGRALVGVLERHDRARVRVLVVSTGGDDGSAMRRRLRAAADEWLDAAPLDDAVLVHELRARRIAVAVDLAGHTARDQHAAFAAGIAPVQCTWLGYAGTVAAPGIDWLLADEIAVPSAERRHYAERIVDLPLGLMPNDSALRPGPAPSRESAGLPARAVVCAAMHAPSKIVPAVYDAWLAVLRDVPDAVLWLRASEPGAIENLRARAEAVGIDGARLVVAPRVSDAEHLARLQLADLFLDTFPYGAHSSARDALWCGVPVLTLAGRSYASRVSTSLLARLGVDDELVTSTPAEYADRACALVRDPARRLAVRARIAAVVPRAPSFDARAFAAQLENVYFAMLDAADVGLTNARRT